ARRTSGLAGALTSKFALKSGDRVGVVMKNTPQYIEVMFAVWHAGLVVVPVNAKLHQRETGCILQKADISLCFTDLAQAESICAVTDKPVVACNGKAYEQLVLADPVEILPVKADHLAWIFFTSGTTGRPKGAMLSHGNLMTMTLNYFADFDRVRPGDTIYHPAPLSHGAGLWVLPHVCAMACNVIPESGRFDPLEIFSDLQAWPNVSMFAAPTMVRRLTLFEPDFDTGNLKLVIYGGAPMYVSDCIEALDRFGNKLAQLYGQGESPMTITHLSRDVIADRAHPDWRYRLGTVGVADSCMEVQVVDENNNRVATGQVGEIVCRGDAVMAGYWRDQVATDATLKDSWLHTGDVGHLDESGFLTLTDRSKDLIISGGSNIYPREVEEVLLAVQGVQEVSVVGRPDEEWGEIVVAYVVGDADADLLDDHCLDNIARFKRPKIYRFVEELPKNNYGKVLKSKLREREKLILT
ncbi:MAG TPA: long-chain fatty acid--CoA ligase, partial [Rhizobiales bacterium]|nr:long-chain fatty acid--CoA ligase [Hyphomicrobiales bacterium]